MSTRTSMLILAVSVLSACSANATTTPPSPSAATVPTAAATASPTPPATDAAVNEIFDTATTGQMFDLPMKVTLGKEWRALPVDIKGAVGLVHVGTPADDQRQWWGPDIWLVDGALIHDPSDVVSDAPAKPDRSRFVAWPADLFAYISSLPGVEIVSGPEPITIGSVTGTQIVARTPQIQPLVWLEGDYAWMGGGGSGLDPAATRHIALLDVHGKKVYLSFVDAPEVFGARLPLVKALYASIEFGT